MAQSVVPAKEKKLDTLYEKHGSNLSEDEFAEIFKSEYPRDWDRINKVYRDEELKTKPGKHHPMPEPTKYLKNMYKVYMAKHS